MQFQGWFIFQIQQQRRGAQGVCARFNEPGNQWFPASSLHIQERRRHVETRVTCDQPLIKWQFATRAARGYAQLGPLSPFWTWLNTWSRFISSSKFSNPINKASTYSSVVHRGVTFPPNFFISSENFQKKFYFRQVYLVIFFFCMLDVNTVSSFLQDHCL